MRVSSWARSESYPWPILLFPKLSWNESGYLFTIFEAIKDSDFLPGLLHWHNISSAMILTICLRFDGRGLSFRLRSSWSGAGILSQGIQKVLHQSVKEAGEATDDDDDDKLAASHDDEGGDKDTNCLLSGFSVRISNSWNTRWTKIKTLLIIQIEQLAKNNRFNKQPLKKNSLICDGGLKFDFNCIYHSK